VVECFRKVNSPGDLLEQLPSDTWSLELISVPVSPEGVPNITRDIDIFKTLMLG
jgi:hypothetical protein